MPRLFNALTKSSLESAASVFRKMQFDKSVGAHTWELGAMPRSACVIPFGIGLFLKGSGTHDWRNFSYVLEVRALYPFLLYYVRCCFVEEVCLFEAGIM